MKTNWGSTWPAIYQSPAAEMVLFACEGIHFIEKYFKTTTEAWREKKERDTRTQKGRERKRGKFNSSQNYLMDSSKTHRNVQFLNDIQRMPDVNQSESLISTLIPPFTSYLVTEAEQQMREMRARQRETSRDTREQ